MTGQALIDTVQKVIDENHDIYLKLYDYLQEAGQGIPEIKKDDLPRNFELERVLTKVLTYSYFIGLTDKPKTKTKKTKIKNASVEDITEFDFNLPYNEAYDYFKRMSGVNYKTYYNNLKTYAGKAFTISWINSIETLDQVNKLFADQMKDGFDPKKLGELIQEVITSRGEQPLENWHLETVINTNAQTAFSRGHMIAQRESGLPYWQYLAVIDGRESELCAGLDGKVFRSDDPFWNAYYPPNHYNCRSTVIALDEDDIKKDDLNIEPDGKDYIENNPEIKPANKEPIRGFKFSPLNALDNYLKEKCQELGIDLPKDQEPV